MRTTISSICMLYYTQYLSCLQCQHVAGMGFHRGSYQCKCRPEFYQPVKKRIYSSRPITELYFNGSEVELAYIRKLMDPSDDYYDNMSSCRPCATGCLNCINATPCEVEYDVMMRGIPLGIQSFCMTISVVLAMVIIHLRTKKVSLKTGLCNSVLVCYWLGHINNICKSINV